MKSLEQVSGKTKTKVKHLPKEQEKPDSYPSREMSLIGPCGAYRLTWKLKYDRWFLCEGSRGWHRVFNDCYTEPAFRQWLRHHPNHHYTTTPDSHPPFKLLVTTSSETTTDSDSLSPRKHGERVRSEHAHSSPVD